MLRAAVTRSAAATGPQGTAAVQAFADHTFDFNAAQAIKHGHVSVEQSPLDMCLGVLPLAQLAPVRLAAASFVRPGGFDSPPRAGALRVLRGGGGRLDPTAGLARA